jgi:ligand-binding sensor domain-containing protein
LKKLIVTIFALLFLIINLSAQWEQVTTIPFGGNNYSLAVNGNDIYHGTLFGLFHSSDNGSYWSTIDFGGVDSCVKTIIIDGNYIYLGTPAEGVFVSTDAGLAWEARNNGLTNLAIHCFTIMGSSIFVATEGGVFVSDNQGILWTGINNGITNASIRALTNLDGVLFAGSDGGGVYVSTNNGQNWAVKNNGLVSWYISHLFTYGSKVFLGTDYDLYESSNNGNTWQTAGLGTYAKVLSSTSLNSGLYVGTDGQGVYYSTNGGGTWTEWNDGFQNKNVYSLAICSEEIFAGVCCGYGLWKREQLSVGIAENSTPGNFVVFPNPANDFILLNSDVLLLGSAFSITDFIGKTITHGKLMKEITLVDIQHLSPGFYFLKVTNDNLTEQIRQIIKL